MLQEGRHIGLKDGALSDAWLATRAILCNWRARRCGRTAARHRLEAGQAL